MSKEGSLGLALGLVAIAVGVFQTMYPIMPPYIGYPIVAIAGAGAIILTIYGLRKKKHLKSTYQIYDAEMVKHLTQIKKMLDTFKKQLMAISNKKGLLGNLEITIEKQGGFYQIWEHCPSMLKAGRDLRLSRVLHEAKLKKNLVTAEDDTHIRGGMKTLAEAIDNCLSDGEYLEHSCSNCVKKHKKMREINKVPSSASVQSKEGYQN